MRRRCPSKRPLPTRVETAWLLAWKHALPNTSEQTCVSSSSSSSSSSPSSSSSSFMPTSCFPPDWILCSAGASCYYMALPRLELKRLLPTRKLVVVGVELLEAVIPTTASISYRKQKNSHFWFPPDQIIWPDMVWKSRISDSL
eukprot:gb/GEZN01021705.1/.p1 GENE.gb/GEZN01021705.1/~~gb/GEZN01021705.1/.p1  ORF type:complete len:143 (+),score=41.41 gb/GEZN01021705.1/:190-618(+)